MSDPNPHDKPTKSNVGITNVYNVTNPGWAGCISLFVFMIWWIGGVVLAKGFWATTAGIFFFPYALYLVVERVMQMLGMV